jgi:tetratricopeptide (TPR) repeat protein
MSFIIVLLLALALLALVALPLLLRGYRDPLPDSRDPLLVELEEEREALFRAIRELDARDDLASERREALRQRYEAKAAKVLRQLDNYQAPAPPARQEARAMRHWPLAALLGVMVVSVVVLGNYVLPRVGPDALITTFFPERLAVARELQRLEREARDNPNPSTRLALREALLALGEDYWQAGYLERARNLYQRIITEFAPAPALAYRRLGFLALQAQDINAALPHLETAVGLEPYDLDSLFALAEIHFTLGNLDRAIANWQAFLAAPGGQGNAAVQARLAMAAELAPLIEQVQSAPGEASFMALADALWSKQEHTRAADLYFQVLTRFNPHSSTALSRLGVALFLTGDNDNAMLLLERARSLRPFDLETLLFLGNAYFSAERFGEAIAVWQEYVTAAGGPELAGRVPGLIESARARLGGAAPVAEPSAAAPVTVSTPALFAANCASCHGPLGQSGLMLSGGVQIPVPALANNPNSADPALVRAVLLQGRGAMPSFAHLPAGQLEQIVVYVTETLYPGEATHP